MATEISTIIKDKREQKGLNKAKLGDLVGVSGAAIGQYENGTSLPSMKVIFKLQEILKWDLINDKPIVNNGFIESNENITKSNKEIFQREKNANNSGFSSPNKTAIYRAITEEEKEAHYRNRKLIENETRKTLDSVSVETLKRILDFAQEHLPYSDAKSKDVQMILADINNVYPKLNTEI